MQVFTEHIVFANTPVILATVTLSIACKNYVDNHSLPKQQEQPHTLSKPQDHLDQCKTRAILTSFASLQSSLIFMPVCHVCQSVVSWTAAFSAQFHISTLTSFCSSVTSLSLSFPVEGGGVCQGPDWLQKGPRASRVGWVDVVGGWSCLRVWRAAK